MKLGDKISQRVLWTECLPGRQINWDRAKNHKPAEGTVVYIHPLGRYYTLEFAYRGGVFRESFIR